MSGKHLLFLIAIAAISCGSVQAQTNTSPSSATVTTSSSLAFTSDRAAGRFQIFGAPNVPLASPKPLTTGGAGNQESRGPDWSPKKGLFAYQFGAPGVRGIHVMNRDGIGSVRVTPPMSTNSLDPLR